MLHFSSRNAEPFFQENESELMATQVEAALGLLREKNGPGSDFLGWLQHPETYDREEFARILDAARAIREEAEVLVVIGIGGSYLGARAVIEALRSPFSVREGGCEVIFAGYNLSGHYAAELSRYLKTKRFAINVISKSGTTTEPAVSFRLLKAQLEAQVGRDEAKKRIYVTTDRSRGALKTLAEREGYPCFVVPDDIGGRYSVLSAVGLLPIAAAGLDIEALMSGARDAMERCRETDWRKNDACRYAMARNLLLRRGYEIEILVNYEPGLHFISEWWKQLYGESEGKCGRGLFPAAVDNTSDLHSMGQYIQEGRRVLTETVLWVDEMPADLRIETEADNLDGLNFLAGKTVSEVNRKAMQATALAHVDGGVPNLMLRMEKLDERHIGELIYFFEFACALSGYLNAVNPFDQPGVEAYKKNMFALLGKPSYEKEQDRLERRLEDLGMM